MGSSLGRHTRLQSAALGAGFWGSGAAFTATAAMIPIVAVVRSISNWSEAG